MANNKWWCSAAVTGFLALGAVPLSDAIAQDPAQQDPQQAPPKAKASEIPALIEQLGAKLYKERRAAERALEGIGEPAVEALREAAKSHIDPEVQWRAERLVEQLGRGAKGGDAPEGGLQPRGEAQPTDPVDRTRDFLDRVRGDLGGQFPLDDPDWVRRVREQLDRQMAELERGFGGFKVDWDQLQKGGSSSGTQVQITPDGVRVEVREPGAAEPKVYEAPDMEAFRKKYPEVAERHLSGMHFDIKGSFGGADPFSGPLGGQGLLPRPPGGLQPRPWGEVGEPAAPPPADRRLGVTVGTLHPAVADYLGGGIQVQEVQDGTLAETLKIQSGDVVLKINERAIVEVPDVADALGAIAAGAKVEVTVNRRGHMVVLSGTKTNAEAEVDESGTGEPARGGLKPRKK